MNRFGDQHVLFLSIIMLLGALHFETLFSMHGQTLLLAPVMTIFVGVSTALLLASAGFFHPLRPYPRMSDLILLVCTVMIATIFAERVFVLFLVTERLPLYRTVFAVSASLGVSVFVLYYLLSRFVGRAYWKKQIVLYMKPLSSVRFIQNLAHLGYAEYIEFVSFDQYRARVKQHDPGAYADLVVWSDDSPSDQDDVSPLLRSHLAGIPMSDESDILSYLSGRVSLDQFALWQFVSKAKPQTGGVQLFWRLKALVEPVVAVVLLVLFLPVFAVVALLIKAESKGPVIFSQRRVGLFGKEFTLYKFRSMRTDAESSGPQWSAPGDARITRLGAILRKTRLDELPQLVNVLKGEMSFCGPRPERPEMYDRLEPKIPYFWLRTLVKPGISGWAQVQAGYAASIAESKKKLEFDLYYIKYMSPRLDLIILWYTVMYAFGFHAPRAEYDSRVPKIVEVNPYQERAA